jgi:hypothetical protein
VASKAIVLPLDDPAIYCGLGRIRTSDAGIFSPALYQLSYQSIRVKGEIRTHIRQSHYGFTNRPASLTDYKHHIKVGQVGFEPTKPYGESFTDSLL